MKELLKNEALFLMLEKVMGKKIGKDGIYKIQQAGQKYAGICYMDVADEFFYQCLSNTTSTVNDGALFKKIGVSENEDKLSNLYEFGSTSAGWWCKNNITKELYQYFFANSPVLTGISVQFFVPYPIPIHSEGPVHVSCGHNQFAGFVTQCRHDTAYRCSLTISTEQTSGYGSFSIMAISKF